MIWPVILFLLIAAAVTVATEPQQDEPTVSSTVKE